MKIPEYSRQVERGQAPSAGTPQVAPPPGAVLQTAQQLAATGAQAGAVTSDLGSKIAERAIERQRMDDEKQVLQANTAYLQEKQDRLNSTDVAVMPDGKDAPAGILNRKLGQAKDATVEYDQDYADRKARYLDMVPGAMQKAALAKLLDQDHLSTRAQIISHEREQLDKDYVLTAEANVKQQALNVASVNDPKAVLNTVNIATGLQSAAMSRMGASPEAVKLRTQGVADEVVGSAVKGNLERNPAASLAILTAAKGTVSESAFQEMQQIVDGKMLDLRRSAAWEDASRYTHADGTIDMTKAEAAATAFAAAQKLPPGQSDHVLDFVRQKASIHDSALKDSRDSQTRSFFNEALALKGRGASYDDAAAQLFKQKGYGFDGLDREEKTKQLQALFTRDGDFYDAMMKAQTPAQKAAWDDIKNMGEAKYPKGTKIKLEGEDFFREAKDVFENEMMRRVIGQPPEQMRKIANDALKNVATVDHKWWFTNKTMYTTSAAAYKTAAEVRAADELKIAGVQDVYGQQSVAQARTALAASGNRKPTAQDIRSWIERK